MREWYRFTAKSDKSAEVLIYDEIGPDPWGDGMSVGAKDFRKDLTALGDIQNLDVRINSPGGDVFDGTAIYNTLRSHKARITVHIDGIAASIASVIAMAGDEIIAPANAMMMVHNPSGLVMGTAPDMRKMAEALDKVGESIVAAYARTGQGKEDLMALMESETWMTAADAAALGFVDTVTDEARYAAKFSMLKRFSNLPDELQAMQAENDQTENDQTESDESGIDSEPYQPKPYAEVLDLVVARRLRNQRILRAIPT